MNLIIVLFSIPILWNFYLWIYNKFIYPKNLDKLRNFIDDNNYKEALKILKKLPEEKKNNTEILFYLARVQIYQKQWYLANYNLEKIILNNKFTNNISEIVVRTNKMEIYKNLNKPKELIRECQLILSLDPINIEANTELGFKLFGMKNYKIAKDCLENVSPKNKNPKVHEFLFDIYIIDENYIMAYDTICHIIDNLQITHCRILFKKSKVQYYLNNYSEALNTINSIDKTYKAPLEMKIIEGICYFMTKKINKSYHIFTNYLKKYIDDYSDLVLRSRYYYSYMLISFKLLTEAINQMRFIGGSNRTYKDNAIRYKLYKDIFNNDILKDIYYNYPNEEKTNNLILKIINEKKNWKIIKSFQNSEDWQLLHLKEKKMRQDLHVLFSLNQKSIDKITIQKIKENLNPKELTRSNLLALTLFKVNNKEIDSFNLIFDKCNFVNEFNLLELLKDIHSDNYNNKKTNKILLKQLV